MRLPSACNKTRPEFEVWAQLFLCDSDADLIKAFLIKQYNVKPNKLIPRMHITIYHARRPMWRLAPADESARVVILTNSTRFMVLAPGGENPRPEFRTRDSQNRYSYSERK